jgi:glycosyltransferase involved in cell wall biosynthesis
MTGKKEILFVSTMAAYPWGGSEELWSRTAIQLVRKGISVAASVHGWAPASERVLHLVEAGIPIQLRRAQYPLWKRAVHKVSGNIRPPLVREVEQLFTSAQPYLVVFSDGGAAPPVELLEMCASKRVPFVTISQANSENWWLDDELANRYRRTMGVALRCYFVSRANRRLFEMQIGCALPNAEIVWNPFNVDINATPARLPLHSDGEVYLACVGRLHPPSKGQDILLEALADPAWTDRRWRLTFYGKGTMQNSIERMVHYYGLQDRVTFAGHVASVEGIWANNHVLVMPSRYEGLPLAIVEAMLCGRPVVATNIAGNSEVVEDGVSGFLADAPTVPSMANALERFWLRRTDLEEMGTAAAASIRERVPADPVGLFSANIEKLVFSTQSVVPLLPRQHVVSASCSS